MKILVVEDEKDLVNVIANYLQNADYVCEFAMDFFMAEDKLISYDYDIVVLDINLPDGNGLESFKIN